MKYKIHTETDSSEKSNELLSAVKTKYGFIPNLMGVLAESSPVLESYMELGSQLSKSTLTAEEIQVLYLAANYENDCHYCMAAHSTVASSMKINEDTIKALRSGQDLKDPKLNALAKFTKAVIDKKGWLDEKDLSAFLEVGYTKANILEVILGVAHKTISNYVNHINLTPVDDNFKSQEWSKS